MNVAGIGIILTCFYFLYAYSRYQLQWIDTVIVNNFIMLVGLLCLVMLLVDFYFNNNYTRIGKVWVSSCLLVLVCKLWETETNFLDLVFSKWSIKVIRIWSVDERLGYVSKLSQDYLSVFRPTDAQLAVMAQRSQTMEQVREELLSFVEAKILALQEIQLEQEVGSFFMRHFSFLYHDFFLSLFGFSLIFLTVISIINWRLAFLSYGSQVSLVTSHNTMVSVNRRLDRFISTLSQTSAETEQYSRSVIWALRREARLVELIADRAPDIEAQFKLVIALAELSSDEISVLVKFAQSLTVFKEVLFFRENIVS